MDTPVFEQVAADLGFSPRCSHSVTWTTRGRPGGCLNCGQCFHTVIVRENAGASIEFRWCGDCGEDLGQVRN